ncbi:unnamed protein product, partial [marine sediment metagenome]
MLSTLALIIPLALAAYIFAYYCDREEARVQADELIAGIRKATPKDIDKCMRKLRIATSRLLDRIIFNL